MNNKGNANENYKQRQSHNNIAEELFEDWSLKKKYKIFRLGFDEKNKFVNSFYNLSEILRNLPDFVIERDGKIFVVNVKGTSNIKRKEYEMLPKLIDCFSTYKSPLIYAFCFTNTEPIFKNAEKVIELYEHSAEDKTWSDGVIYRKLKI